MYSTKKNKDITLTKQIKRRLSKIGRLSDKNIVEGEKRNRLVFENNISKQKEVLKTLKGYTKKPLEVLMTELDNELLGIKHLNDITTIYDDKGERIEYNRRFLKGLMKLEEEMNKISEKEDTWIVPVRKDIRNRVKMKDGRIYPECEMRIMEEGDYKGLLRKFSYLKLREVMFKAIRGYAYCIERGVIDGKWHMHLVMFVDLKRLKGIIDFDIGNAVSVYGVLMRYMKELNGLFFRMVNNKRDRGWSGVDRVTMWDNVCIGMSKWGYKGDRSIACRNQIRGWLWYIAKDLENTKREKKKNKKYVGRSHMEIDRKMENVCLLF